MEGNLNAFWYHQPLIILWQLDRTEDGNRVRGVCLHDAVRLHGELRHRCSPQCSVLSTILINIAHSILCFFPRVNMQNLSKEPMIWCQCEWRLLFTTKNKQYFTQQSYTVRNHTDNAHFWCLKKLVEIILVVFKVGIVKLFVILHQPSASFLL